MISLLRRLQHGLLYRWKQLQKPPPPEFSVSADGHTWSEVRVLASGQSGSPLTKIGRITLQARLDGTRVKVVECHTPEQARFVEKLSHRSGPGAFLPECLLVRERFVVLRWIRGETVPPYEFRKNRNLLSALARIQCQLHRCSEPPGDPGFDYVEDLLIPRYEKFRVFFPFDEFENRILPAVKHPPDSGRRVVGLPDLTPRNLILRSKPTDLCIVDLELLTLNAYPLVDLLNTFHGFFESDASLYRRYFSHYRDHGGRLQPLMEHRGFYEALWTLRVVGSLLQAGKFGQAQERMERYIRGFSPLPELYDSLEAVLSS